MNTVLQLDMLHHMRIGQRFWYLGSHLFSGPQWFLDIWSHSGHGYLYGNLRPLRRIAGKRASPFIFIWILTKIPLKFYGLSKSTTQPLQMYHQSSNKFYRNTITVIEAMEVNFFVKWTPLDQQNHYWIFMIYLNLPLKLMMWGLRDKKNVKFCYLNNWMVYM